MNETIDNGENYGVCWVLGEPLLLANFDLMTKLCACQPI